MTLQDWLPEAVTVLLAGAGGFFGYGKLSARMTSVEQQNRDLKVAVEKLGDIKVSVATIEERTRNTDEAVKGQAGDLREITKHLLDEGRSFAQDIVRNRNRARPSA